MAIIKPTVGRKVWYRPNLHDEQSGVANFGQPLDATIVAVWSDSCVNLAIFDAYGMPHQRRSVVLMQDNMNISPGSAYAEWMPYQAAQAVRHAALPEIYGLVGLGGPELLPVDCPAAPSV